MYVLQLWSEMLSYLDMPALAHRVPQACTVSSLLWATMSPPALTEESARVDSQMSDVPSTSVVNASANVLGVIFQSCSLTKSARK